MSSAKYQALPNDDYDEELSPVHNRHLPEHYQLAQDPRFNPPTPPWWKRALIILFIIAMFWLYFSMQQGAGSKVIHAQRYSKQYKFRPAASPVIYEKLKGGQTRVRGAAPSLRNL
ncbi:hypothetical protein BGY98DRAFT_978579 [Russula aff. rugulosa BPL654]|nr:hypothetical protein BGY98DRAFT_978579 [Russula aff. rugulosa BPL654]